ILRWSMWRQIWHTLAQYTGKNQRDNARPPGAGQPQPGNGPGRDERPDKNADTLRASHDGKSAAPKAHRHRLHQVGLPCQVEYGQAHSLYQYAGSQHEKIGCPQAEKQADNAEGSGTDQRPPLAKPANQESRRNIVEQQAQADQADNQARDRMARAQRRGSQGNDWQNGPCGLSKEYGCGKGGDGDGSHGNIGRILSNVCRKRGWFLWAGGLTSHDWVGVRIGFRARGVARSVLNDAPFRIV